ncbi:hypothetical protein DICPUDRAFT_33776 [Dictyostelium purpureum]|uniref:Elongation of fatty acids protein n=1 Tax=Dictyostelium purpureum TaxID=5786 RepID=F0ZLG5_DICPU|nr:uncharacterized protein DICPUDRAFT_33776 [Dictyostelium purpureum]EGC35229.1 hypothetical protein DICPUDRAFT_33776 [Dictyostelium purpureum]|eukprot:XP_003288267.1 hypothetical protein DICPUDRAFT_33776 [Dictyostelium purpureum]
MTEFTLIYNKYYNSLSETYNYYLSRRDERLLNLPLVNKPQDMIILILSYYFIIFFGKKLMKTQKPFNLRYPLIIHNAFCTLLSVYMVFEILHQANANDYSLVCNPVDYSEKGIGMAKVLWLFYFSKFIEFIDTIFMVLRKKDNQITVSGDSYISALMNSIIHSIMYSYYTLALFGINVWWKKYLTQIQLIQFVVNIAASGYSIYNDCNFVKGLHWLMIGYMLCFVTLFGAFYIKTYIKKSSAKKKSV